MNITISDETLDAIISDTILASARMTKECISDLVKIQDDGRLATYQEADLKADRKNLKALKRVYKYYTAHSERKKI